MSSNYRPGGPQKSVLTKMRAEMEVFDTLPEELRRAMAESCLPLSPTLVASLCVRTPAAIVAGFLKKEDERHMHAYHRRISVALESVA